MSVIVPLLVFFRLRRTVQRHLRKVGKRFVSLLLPQVLWVEKHPQRHQLVPLWVFFRLRRTVQSHLRKQLAKLETFCKSAAFASVVGGKNTHNGNKEIKEEFFHCEG